jgi:uroporphyrinogen-III synthase
LRILVTRPSSENTPLANLLEGCGHTVIHSPMLTIQQTPFQSPGEKAHAVVFTSRHAVAPAASIAAVRVLPAFCIGPASADAAKAAGFTVVAQANGDRGTLIGEIARHRPKHILFMSGADERGDIVSELAAAKVRATRSIVYRAALATAFSDDARAALAAHALDIALLFSPRSASAFAKLSHDVTGFDRSKLTIACLSDAVAEAAGGNWATVHVAAAPTTKDILECAGLLCDSAREALKDAT